MKYRVKWTSVAKKDLNEIIDYIANDEIDIARKQFLRIKESAENLKLFPEQGRYIPELLNQNIRKYKEIIITPWRLMYKIENEIVYILAVIDGRRNIEDILMKRQMR